MHVQEMISTHPHVRGSTNDALIRCIEACYDCAQTCTVCADACLGEDMVKDLIQCVRLNLDCADVCAATGQIASRRDRHERGDHQAHDRDLRRGLPAVRRGMREARPHEHCRICAESCRRCEQACREAAGTITPILQ